MKDGKTAEAGIVGNEGFTGTTAAVGLIRSTLQAIVQITGDGFRVEVGALQNTLESAPHLLMMLSRSIDCLSNQHLGGASLSDRELHLRRSIRIALQSHH
jgi:hypothetical protein